MWYSLASTTNSKLFQQWRPHGWLLCLLYSTWILWLFREYNRKWSSCDQPLVMSSRAPTAHWKYPQLGLHCKLGIASASAGRGNCVCGVFLFLVANTGLNAKGINMAAADMSLISGFMTCTYDTWVSEPVSQRGERACLFGCSVSCTPDLHGVWWDKDNVWTWSLRSDSNGSE